MSNESHRNIIAQGVEAWNSWRARTSDLPDLTGAELMGRDLSGINLMETRLRKADLKGANLSNANLFSADLSDAILRDAILDNTRLVQTVLVNANLRGATITTCQVYGISAWNLNLDGATQKVLIVDFGEPGVVKVDDLEIAQFIYLLLDNRKIRRAIDTISSKAVLILGRFTPERKAILSALTDQLRTYDLLPIVFDFERSASRTFTETIKTLAGMCFFVIVDITNPRSAPLELQGTVPDYQVPFVPLLQEGEKPFAMFSDLLIYPWVLKPVITYPSVEELLRAFEGAILNRAWEKHQELQKQKAESITFQSVSDFMASNELL